MVLAGMIGMDETALICDLAETYHILDYRALPLTTVAALASGLRDDSRIKMKLSGSKISRETALLAGAVDRLSLILWSRTKDGVEGRNKPASILSILMGVQEQEENEFETFETPEAFEAYWRQAFGHTTEEEV